MGGYGSGRYFRYNTKCTVEDCRSVDANDFARWKMFREGQRYTSTRWTLGDRETGSCGVITQIGDGLTCCAFLFNNRRVPVALSWYAPGYGGRRYFFLCPVCHRRVRTLHFKGRELACRICHNLTYKSCNESHSFDRLYMHMAESFHRDGKGVSWTAVKWYMRNMIRSVNKRPRRPRGRPKKCR